MKNIIDSSFFDKEYNRKNTGALKYDADIHTTYQGDLIPMWIADMDFKTAPQIEEALVKEAQSGIYGYNITDNEYDLLLKNWYIKRMNWNVNPEHNIKTPGVVFAISAAINAFTDTGDAVLICQPVYHPFANIIKGNNRKLVINELLNINGHYEIDFDDFERKIIDNKVKLFLLCSPHNPVSRVWTKDELLKIAEICLKHNVLVISDEIHSDFVFGGYKHIPFASLSKEIADITITCTAPSKTFNTAGLQLSNIFVSNDNIRKILLKAYQATGYGRPNNMGITATKAAYKYGEEWLNALLAYLENNVKLLDSILRDTNGKVRLIKPEGTYLMWLDCRNLELSDKELERLFLDKAGVWLINGSTFGKCGSGYMRMNIACPQSILKQAAERIVNAVKN
ncbi:MAG: pyridoxal phosphate-dependent aminotransferase [Ruminococcus sp.]|nr:pyridoxal phosphate-dependent aminotransferase [Ruminococcus sp.]